VSQSETIATELAVLADGLDSSAQFLRQTAGTLRGLAERVTQMAVGFCQAEAKYLERGVELEAEVLKLRNEAAK
jgi:hypothetical protein